MERANKAILNLRDIATLTTDELANMTEEELQQYVMRRGREQDMSDAQAAEEFQALNKQRLEHRGRRAGVSAEKAR
tara:strand:+ start:355 stop:582 length:228 start_codon:yes stop_codon:yes gene_type:complete